MQRKRLPNCNRSIVWTGALGSTAASENAVVYSAVIDGTETTLFDYCCLLYTSVLGLGNAHGQVAVAHLGQLGQRLAGGGAVVHAVGTVDLAVSYTHLAALEGKQLVKEIYVKGRLVNLAVKG